MATRKVAAVLIVSSKDQTEVVEQQMVEKEIVKNKEKLAKATKGKTPKPTKDKMAKATNEKTEKEPVFVWTNDETELLKMTLEYKVTKAASCLG